MYLSSAIITIIATTTLLAALAAAVLVILRLRAELVRLGHDHAVLRRDLHALLESSEAGIFMLDPQLRIEPPYSALTPRLLRCRAPEGEDFVARLRALSTIDEDKQTEAKRYVQLLFGERVNDRLVNALNPLSEVPVELNKTNRQGWLCFQFTRIIENRRVVSLLVRVRDITTDIEQRKRLAELNGLLLHEQHGQTRLLTATDLQTTLPLNVDEQGLIRKILKTRRQHGLDDAGAVSGRSTS